jgi:hypothetical protein
VFGGSGWRGAPYQGQYQPRYDPYQYSYSKPKSYTDSTPPPKKPKVERPKPVPTQALWCESGDHSFSEKDKKKRVYSEEIQTGEDDYGNPKYKQEYFTVCGPCSASHSPFQTRTNSEVEESPKEERSKVVQDESYLAGYRDGIIKGETIP